MDYEAEQLKRIADAIEEILRLVKKDMEPRTKKRQSPGIPGPQQCGSGTI